MLLYKILTNSEWKQSEEEDCIVQGQNDREFIHFAEKEDVQAIADKFFAHENEVLVAEVESRKLLGRLVKEKNPGGSKEYYHLYEGSIPKNAVLSTSRCEIGKRT